MNVRDRIATTRALPPKQALFDSLFLNALLITQTIFFVAWVVYVTNVPADAFSFVNDIVQEKWLFLGIRLVQFFYLGSIALYCVLSYRKRFTLIVVSLVELIVSVYAGVSS